MARCPLAVVPMCRAKALSSAQVSTGSGSATVSGAGSTWANSLDFGVGHNGTGILSVENGGQVSMRHANIGNSSNGNGTVSISGTGSQINATGDANVGYINNSGVGSLSIADGGQMSNVRGFIRNGSATINGANSQWNNSNYLYVYGNNSNLNIQDGGTVSASYSFLYSGGKATIDGNNSHFDLATDFSVGYSGTGTLNQTGRKPDLERRRLHWFFHFVKWTGKRFWHGNTLG